MTSEPPPESMAAGKSHVLLAPTTKAVEALKREIPEGQVQTVEAFLLASQKGATSAAAAFYWSISSRPWDFTILVPSILEEDFTIISKMTVPSTTPSPAT
jgi:hypothetical protein